MENQNIDQGIATLTKKERKQMRREERRKEHNKEHNKERNKQKVKNIANIAIAVFVVGGVVIALGWFVMSRPSLPPTSMQGHIEQSPPAHILTQPIVDKIQRHMLEHADGRGKPGVLIQYNCSDFVCEAGLIQQLTDLVKQYPDNVYLAPNNYDGKIILTKIGRRKVLDNFDKQAIEDFIER